MGIARNVFLKSFEVVVEQGEQKIQLGVLGNLIIVCVSGEVCIVDGFLGAKGRARQIHSDANKGIIYPMPARNPWSDRFKHATILVRDAGCKVGKVTKHYRLKLKELAYRAYIMAQVAFNGVGRIDALCSITDDACSLCNPLPCVEQEPVFQCPLCFTNMHKRSQDCLIAHANSDVLPCSALLGPFVCLMCSCTCMCVRVRVLLACLHAVARQRCLELWR